MKGSATQELAYLQNKVQAREKGRAKELKSGQCLDMGSV